MTVIQCLPQHDLHKQPDAISVITVSSVSSPVWHMLRTECVTACRPPQLWLAFLPVGSALHHAKSIAVTGRLRTRSMRMQVACGGLQRQAHVQNARLRLGTAELS
eukprot:jgi/Ulvmu1/371/UM001_0378.1